MQSVQLALAHTPYASALEQALLHDGAFRGWSVLPVERPDVSRSGVIVADAEALDQMPFPLPNPERVVLITRNEPEQLRRAWEAGIVSVVFENEPVSTAMLAILAAQFRARQAAVPAKPQRAQRKP